MNDKQGEMEFMTKVFVKDIVHNQKNWKKQIKDIILFNSKDLEEVYVPIDSKVQYSDDKIVITCADRSRNTIIDVKDIKNIEYCTQVSCLMIKTDIEENIIYLPEEEKDKLIRILKKAIEICS